MKTLRRQKVVAILLSAIMTFALFAVSPIGEVKAAEAEVRAINNYGETFPTFEDAVNSTYRLHQEGTVILTANDTLENDLEIPDTIQAIIPTSGDYDDTPTGAHNVRAEYDPNAQSPYVTLTVNDGVTIDLFGTLLVAGNQLCTTPYAGILTGKYGNLVLNSEASIYAEDGSVLYARGEVTGNGTIFADYGSSIYQLLQVDDWRGGTVTTEIYLSVFPFNEYRVDNIQCPITYSYGSKLIAQYYVAGVSPLTHRELVAQGDASVIDSGSSGNALYVMKSEDSSVVINKDKVELNGQIANGSFSITIPTALGNFTISTAGRICPVYKMNVTVSAGSTLDITESLRFLPGSSLTVNGTTTVSSGKALYFYTSNDFNAAFSFRNYPSGLPDATLTVPSTATFTGLVGSSNSAMSNIYVPENPVSTNTAEVREYVQDANDEYTKGFHNITFYTVELPLA